MENSPNIYEQQKRNRRATLLIISLFILFFCFLGYGFDLFYFGIDPLGILGEPSNGFPIATFFAAIIGGVTAAWSWKSGATAVLTSAHAFPVPENDEQYKVLRNVVDEMAIASGLPKPQIYIVPDPDPNAFATGRDPEHSYIAVTEGLLSTLNREELQAVIGHEMSHIRNYDIRLMMIVAALMGGILLLSDGVGRMLRFGGGRGVVRGGSRRSKNAGPLMLILLIIWILAIILAPIITRLLAMAVSREREYLADASGAELTRNPLALANALEKIESAEAPTTSIKKGSAHLCIADPLGKSLNAKEGFFAELFGTHPPISKRITLLKAMAYQYEHLGTPLKATLG
jgi:heat shock protein HtpX